MTDGATAPGDAVQGVIAIEAFLADLPSSRVNSLDAPSLASPSLSHRELEVLRLLAAGRSNQQIADELVISLNTVRRHVSNIFDKTGAANRAQAAVYAKDHGLA
jgi:NarL family two-component system response regulator LiaR